MRINIDRSVFLWAVFLAAPLNAKTEIFDLQGQLSGWLTASHLKATKSQVGLRYIPVFSLKKSWAKKYMIDAELALNAFGSVQVLSIKDIQTRGEIKPYRAWLRFSTSQFEARLGLQKINFGSAMFLRPLMWFDRIDPNDPLQLTDGVHSLLLKYTFLNNANIWLWALYGNDEPKGWEAIPTQDRTAEYGGRFEFPLLKGEMAFSYHRRRIDPSSSLSLQPLANEKRVTENRFGLDGKWDIGPGLWLEGVLTHQDFEFFPLKYQKSLSLGLDYTFSLGHGLHVMGEHLARQVSSKSFGSGETSNFSVLSADYPFGLMDRVKGMVLHDWKTGDWYRFITWQRTYDQWIIYLIAFWNPEHYQIYTSQTGKNLFAGKGFQLMVVFNH